MERKPLLVIIGLLVASFCVYVYNYPPQTTTDAKEAQLSSLNNDISGSKPSTIRMALIEEMVNDYRQIQLKSIENASKNAVKDDSHSILFDLDTLKKFISDIERGVKEVEPKSNPKLGLRMYYASYPLKEKWNEPGYENLRDLLGNEIPKLYERKHTLIMIPVIKTEKGVFADFNPFDKSTYNGFPKRTTRAISLLRNSTDTIEIPALNHGQLIPPASTIGEGF
ncbi:MAG: hypothetical protein ACQUHE_07295 [Bacteroidia bacterium]